MEKKEEIKIAQKKRAKLLAEFERLGDLTITKFAKKHKVSHSRMSLQLKKARKERGDSEVMK